MENITAAELACLGESATVVDVRERDEFANARVPWAVNLPLSELLDHIDEIPDEGPVYVMCLVGGRSAKACQYLERIGKPVVNVLGGIQEWQSEGFPTDGDA